MHLSIYNRLSVTLLPAEQMAQSPQEAEALTCPHAVVECSVFVWQAMLVCVSHADTFCMLTSPRRCCLSQQATAVCASIPVSKTEWWLSWCTPVVRHIALRMATASMCFLPLSQYLSLN